MFPYHTHPGLGTKQAFEREGEVNYGARPRALSPSRAQIPPSPSPFNACHAGYTYSSQLFCSLYFAILGKQKIKTWYLKKRNKDTFIIVVVLSCYVQLWGESLNPIAQIVSVRQSTVLNGRFATSRFLNPKF